MGALCERFDTLGLYARGVADLALLRDALLGVDAAGIPPLAADAAAPRATVPYSAVG